MALIHTKNPKSKQEKVEDYPWGSCQLNTLAQKCHSQLQKWHLISIVVTDLPLAVIWSISKRCLFIIYYPHLATLIGRIKSAMLSFKHDGKFYFKKVCLWYILADSRICHLTSKFWKWVTNWRSFDFKLVRIKLVYCLLLFFSR